MNERTKPDQQQPEEFRPLTDDEVLKLDEWELRRYMSARLCDILSHSSLVATTLRQSFSRDENTTNEIEVELPDGRFARLEKWPEPNQTALQWNQYELITESLHGDGGRTETHIFISPRLFMINEAIYDDFASQMPSGVNRYGSAALYNSMCEREGDRPDADMKLLTLGILRDFETAITEPKEVPAS